MSGVPKRSHGEGSHLSSSSKYPHEDSGSYPNVHYETSQEMWGGKLPRAESRDLDRRSPIHSMYRMSSSISGSPVIHTFSGTQNRSELFRELKENMEDKMEQGELYDQTTKTEKDGRLEGRGDEYKEVKYDREIYKDSKSDAKIDKDGFGAVSSHCNWKEHHKGKRYPDPPVSTGNVDHQNVDSWVNLHASFHGPIDVRKGGPANDDREYAEANDVDLKGENKYNDKDRKWKEGKHPDWGDREKHRNERRSSLQVGSSSVGYKESMREEREAQRWERENDAPKDKERPNKRERDYVNREVSNRVDKEGSRNEKKIVVQASEHENLPFDPKKSNNIDVLKKAERESIEKRKERNSDVEAERPEKRSSCYNEESHGGGVDVDGAIEREGETFSYGVQQPKRVLLPGSSPQVADQKTHCRSRAQDAFESQGMPEVSSVVYKVGESMQELIKLWKEYESSQPQKDGKNSHHGPTLEIWIPAEHVTATNRQVRGGQLWGTDIYTYDSDLVAVLMHTGYCRPTASRPPSTIQELHAIVRVLPPQECYVSTLRNNVRSRAWGAAIGCSYRIEQCCIVKNGGGTIDLEPCLTHTSTIEPTLAPIVVEHTMTTRAAASNALRQQQFMREVTIQYNLCNEPWIKYSLSIVADKGLKKPLYTSARLKKGEVLYLETHSCRYELCFTREKMVKALSSSQVQNTEAEKSQYNDANSMSGVQNLPEGDIIDVFRWSRCKKPLPQKVMLSLGIPLSVDHVEVLEENLDWEDVQWSQTGVWIAGKEYQLTRVHFLLPN
ncbi:hypothetical protein Nepgr_009503 [Nepenthes gracilis]|uniref:Histone deacetylation protein Rxt3 n=1 Tax=Nepenthes gracilis TaxID=150966 RepID=A0AAD3XK71_NEPGR|nr:hypothetical protein Nepgr_009503 [Nepenthes gracilis]